MLGELSGFALLQPFLSLFQNVRETLNFGLLRCKYRFLFFCSVIFINKFLYGKMLEPAVKNFTAGEIVTDGSAVVEGEEVAKHFAIAFFVVVLGNHTFLQLFY